MISVCFAILMAVSVMAFSWPWQATGNAVSDTWLGPVKLYEGKTSNLNIRGEKYTVTINYISNTQVKLKVDGEISQTLTKGNTVSINGLDLNIKDISVKSWAFGSTYVKFMYKKSENVPQSICSGANCILVEGAEVSPTIGDSEYEFGINYIDDINVRLVIGNDFITPKLIAGQSYNYMNKFYVNIQKIIKQDYVGGLSYVMFSVSKISGNTTEPTIPTSSEVTYAGVLDMLGSCKDIDAIEYASKFSSGKDYNCANVCAEEGLKCALGIGTFKANDSSLGDQKVVFRSCSTGTSSTNTYLHCYCCSAP